MGEQMSIAITDAIGDGTFLDWRRIMEAGTRQVSTVVERWLDCRRDQPGGLVWVTGCSLPHYSEVFFGDYLTYQIPDCRVA